MPLRTARRMLASVEIPYLSQWDRQSLYVARRNAMRAATELRQRRRDLEETEAFLESLQRERGVSRDPRVPDQKRRSVLTREVRAEAT
ncbi:MAG TPA: hypothetical protein VLB29_18240 [Nocardioidaceae bacterium]|nr:hypothetical protein [Nocardioidaceae bacterium]